MKNFHLGNVAIALFSFFAASSGSFASTLDDTGFSNINAHRIGETAETKLPLFSGLATPSTCDMTEEAVESAEIVDPPSGAYIVNPDEPDAVALNWLENEMQMSIDPTDEPQAFFPDFSCIEPPYNCPANVKCPELAAGTLCIVTACGTGACPTCPNFFGNAVIMSWCAYGCMKGKDVVGGAYGFWVRGFGWKGPVCFPG